MPAIDPSHYTDTELEPITVIERWRFGFNLGNALKYMARAGKKGERKEDLLKAANYIYREATGEWLPKDLDIKEDRQTGAVRRDTQNNS